MEVTNQICMNEICLSDLKSIKCACSNKNLIVLYSLDQQGYDKQTLIHLYKTETLNLQKNQLLMCYHSK